MRFVSTQLTAPRAEAWRKEGAAVSAGLLFTTPRTPVFRGVVYDDRAQPVWIEPDGNAATELRVQTYRGRPGADLLDRRDQGGHGQRQGRHPRRALPAGRRGALRQRRARRHPRVPADLAGDRAADGVPDAALRPDPGRRPRGRLRVGCPAAGGGRRDRRGAARLGGPRPHRPRPRPTASSTTPARRRCPSTRSTSTRSRRTATRCSSRRGTPARSTGSTAAPAR